jgi:hypothetical protein
MTVSGARYLVRLDELEAKITGQQKAIEALTAAFQAQAANPKGERPGFGAHAAAPRVVAND